MTNETMNTNATIDGEFEAFKVTMGVKPNLPWGAEWWLKNNWRTIERLMMDKDCVLSHKEYDEVFKSEDCWKVCFEDCSLCDNLRCAQNDKGAWVEDDEQVVLDLITKCAHELDKRHSYKANKYSFNKILEEIKQNMENGYSITCCYVHGYALQIGWKRTSREKSNVFGIYDEICALFKSMIRKDDWEEKKILECFTCATKDSIGWKNKVSSWAHENMIGVVPKLGWEQTLAIASETLSRNIVREFLRTMDYGVFGTYEHRVWNSEKRAHETIVEDMGQIMKGRIGGMVWSIKHQIENQVNFIAKHEEFLAKVA